MASSAATPDPAPTAGGFASRSLLVGAGVATSGAGSVVMLAVVAHATSPAVFATFATWWVVGTLVAFPFGVFEAYLARSVVGDLAADRPTRGTVATIGGRAYALALAVGVLASLLDPVLATQVFRHVHGLAPLVGAYVVVAAGQAVQRGYATGSDRFDAVATQLACDGVLRAVLVTLAVLAWPDRAQPVAAAVVVGAAASVAVAHVRLRGWLVRPRLRDRGIPLGPVAVLLLGALGPILINNASVPWLSHLSTRAVLVGAFSGALTMSRVPIQLGGAVFGPLLNAVSHAVERRDVDALRRLNRRAVGAAGAASVVFVVAFTVGGPWALGLFLGSAYHLPAWVFAALGASSGLMVVAVVVQARVAAQQQWGGIAGSWLAAAAVFVVVLVAPLPTLDRAAVSPLAAAVVGLGCLAAVAWRGTPRLTAPEPPPGGTPRRGRQRTRPR